MTINRPLQRKLFMQQGGEPSLEMMQPQQQMMMQPQQQMMVQPTPEESTQALFEQGEQIGQGILSQINEAQDYEQLMNAIRGDEMPVEGRREELAGLVGKQDSQDTPESVLTLVQPTMALIETQGGIDGLMQQVSGDVPVEGNMAQGVGSMLMAGQPTEPVQMADGGVVRKMRFGGANPLLNDSSATGGETVTGGETATGEETVTYEDIEALRKILDSSNVRPSPNMMNRFMRPPVDQKTIDKESAIVGGLSLAMGDTTKPTSFAYDTAKAGLDALGYRSKARDSNLKSMLASAQLGTTKQVGGVQQDAEGYKYVVSMDPFGNPTETYLTNERGEKIRTSTPLELAEATERIKANEESRKRNYVKAGKITDRIFTLEESNDLFQQARKILIEDPDVKKGLGFIGSRLPSSFLNENVRSLRSISQQLGINVINSATFGALSEKELQLALDINLPLDIGREKLIEFIDAKVSAQKKLYNLLEQRRNDLTGRTEEEYNELVNNRKKENNRIKGLFGDDNYKDILSQLTFNVDPYWDADKKETVRLGEVKITKDIWENFMSSDQRKQILDIIDEGI